MEREGEREKGSKDEYLVIFYDDNLVIFSSTRKELNMGCEEL